MERVKDHRSFSGLVGLQQVLQGVAQPSVCARPSPFAGFPAANRRVPTRQRLRA